MSKFLLQNAPKNQVSLKYQFDLAQAIKDRHLSTPQDPSPVFGPMEDWERPDPNAPLPLWNLWGDAGMLTRKNPTDPYPKSI